MAAGMGEGGRVMSLTDQWHKYGHDIFVVKAGAASVGLTGWLGVNRRAGGQQVCAWRSSLAEQVLGNIGQANLARS